jgi:predicted ABC-type transport system involved in lysophospholipase L1 biosynthesis ATPase subunit
MNLDLNAGFQPLGSPVPPWPLRSPASAAKAEPFLQPCHRATGPGAAQPPGDRQPAVLRLRQVGLGEVDLDLTVCRGEIVHLGGGTPVARLRVLVMAAGYCPCGSGSCEVLGFDLCTLAEAERRTLRARHLARVLRGDGLGQADTVLAAVALPMVRLGVAVAEARSRAELELDALGASALAGERPQALGRAAGRLALLARALALRPRLLVLENPEADLPPAAVAAVRLALWALSSAFGTSVLMTTEHPRLLASAGRSVDLDRPVAQG